jgi:hypothetical protein
VGLLTVNSGGTQFKESYNGETNKAPWQYNDAETGWIASVGASLPISQKADLLIDARYQREFETEGTFYVSSDFLLLVGVRLSSLFGTQ